MLAENVISCGITKGAQGKIGANFTFSEEDARGVILHDNDPLVITFEHCNWDIKRVLINPTASSTDVIFWDAFQKFMFDPNDVEVLTGLLTGFQKNRYK